MGERKGYGWPIEKGRCMRRSAVMWSLIALLATGLSGCRSLCGNCLDGYASVIDHFQDYPVLFDTWYNPRLDVSRAGKPDWCGPVNRLVGCRRCNCVPAWSRYDDVWLYPPSYPYVFPGAAYPGPSQSRMETEFRDSYESETINVTPELLPPPLAPIPEPPETEEPNQASPETP